MSCYKITEIAITTEICNVRYGFRGVMLATIFTLKWLIFRYLSFLRILLSDTLFFGGGWVVSFVCVMFVSFPICFFERLFNAHILYHCCNCNLN